MTEHLADHTIVHLEFYRTFPPEPSTIDIDGWLSPQGIFYPCAARGHDRFARHLTGAFYGSLEGTPLLERQGWVRVTTGMFLWARDQQPTMAQYEAACDLLNRDLVSYVEQSVRLSVRRMQRELDQRI